MTNLIFSLVLIVVAVTLMRLGRKIRDNDDFDLFIPPIIFKVIVGLAAAGAAVSLVFTCVYSQDIGDVVVLRNIGGSLAGHTTEAGFHVKAPWQDVITYDVRNNIINMYGSTAYKYDGGNATGPEVSINDKSGTSANIDIQVNYSLNPDSAEKLYSEYGTQTTFTERYILNDFRAIARDVAGQFDTLTMLTDRTKYTDALTQALTAKWSDIGLVVEDVNVQAINYPNSITSKYSDANAAEIEKTKAERQQETAKVEGETKKIQAQAEADANKILEESLSDRVLEQKRIEALNTAAQNDNLIITDGSSGVMVNTK